MKHLLFFSFFIFSTFLCKSQVFSLGQPLVASSDKFSPLGTSSATGVVTYKYLPRAEKFFDREVGSIIVGIKDGYIALTIYNLIPLATDNGVPFSIIDSIEKALGSKFGKIGDTYGMNIDAATFSIKRGSTPLTLNQDRIMIYSSVKQSLLTQH